MKPYVKQFSGLSYSSQTCLHPDHQESSFKIIVLPTVKMILLLYLLSTILDHLVLSVKFSLSQANSKQKLEFSIMHSLYEVNKEKRYPALTCLTLQ